MGKEVDKVTKALRILAPGTPLREGLDSILRARTGALIVVDDSQQVMEIADGGFQLDYDYKPAALYELAKMDGAIILSNDAKRIVWANTHLVPQMAIPTQETGIRHRIAERVARQTGAMVIAISQRRGLITLFQGNIKYVLKDITILLAKANQAIQTLEKYKNVLEEALTNLSAQEFEGTVTVLDVVKVIQRVEMVMRIIQEIEIYIYQLGTEGRLVSMQLEELARDVEEDGNLLIQDYYIAQGDRTPSQINKILRQCSTEELLDLGIICRILGYGGTPNSFDLTVTSRGYRLLRKIPRLPFAVVENLVASLYSLPKILEASIEELDNVEGIGEVRARAIKEGLARLQEKMLIDRHF